MPASFNPFMTHAASTKRSFFASEDIPIPDDHHDATSTTDTIEKAMRYMDKKHNSRFHGWIRSEANISHTCSYMHPIIVEFENGSPHVIHRAVKWLTAGWSVPGTAELIIKLFFHWGIGSTKFSNLVAEVTRSWAVQPYITDLVATLVVAEDVGQVARFIKNFTKDWEVQSVVELMSTISSTLKWEAKYYENFILDFVALERDHQRMTVAGIRQKFQVRKQRLKNLKREERGGTSGNEFCSTIFEMCVLEVHEIRYLRKLESAQQALENMAIPSLESDGSTEDMEGKLSPMPFSLSMPSFADMKYEGTPKAEAILDTSKRQALTASSSSSTLVADSGLRDPWSCR